MPKGYEIRTKRTVHEGIVLNRCVDAETRVMEYQPGNGSRYVLTITRVALPVSTKELRAALGTGDELDTYLVAKLNAGRGHAMLVGGVDHFLHYRTVAEKLGVGLADGVVLAELIGGLVGLRHFTCAEFEELDEA